jgi:hypothetical protein
MALQLGKPPRPCGNPVQMRTVGRNLQQQPKINYG